MAHVPVYYVAVFDPCFWIAFWSVLKLFFRGSEVPVWTQQALCSKRGAVVVSVVDGVVAVGRSSVCMRCREVMKVVLPWFEMCWRMGISANGWGVPGG